MVAQFWTVIPGKMNYFACMSFNEVLHELLGFILEERQLLIRRVLELDDLPLSQADEAVVESRLAYLRKTLRPLCRSMK